MKRKSRKRDEDDWVDESWTVDCICGVNFDDGEEMVDCDECGVWVHTRCSRYDKAAKRFSCHNCKTKDRTESRYRNRNRVRVRREENSEENEVARFLVEMPNKTVRMESSTKRVVPMEERVHVQGIPGGDPELFSGLSRVFSPQLWSSLGYVPKKFGFRYREFPCWDDDDEDDEESDDVVVGGNGNEGRVLSQKEEEKREMKRLDLEDLGVGKSQNGKRERILSPPVVIQSSSTKKGELGREKEADTRKSGALTSPKACSDAKRVEFCEDRGIRTFKASMQSVKNLKSRDSATRESIKALAVKRMDEKVKNNSAVNKHCSDGLSFDKSGTPLVDALGKGSAGNQSITVGSSVGPVLSVLEVDRKAADHIGSRRLYTKIPEKTPQEGLASTASEAKCGKIIQDVDRDRVPDSAGSCVRVRTELDHKYGAVLYIQSSNPSEEKRKVMTYNHMSENRKVNDVSTSCPQSSNRGPIKLRRKSEATSGYHTDTRCASTSTTHQVKQDINGSDCPVKKVALEITNSFGNSSGLSTRQKPLPSVSKSSSSSSTNVISRSSTFDISKLADTQNPSPITREQVTSKFNASKKKTSPKGIVSCEEMNDVSRRVTNSSGNSTVKVKYTSKISQTYVSKRNKLATKDSVNHSSGKASRQNVAVTSGSSDSAGSLKKQNETYLQSKTSGSVSLQRDATINQSNTQPSSNLNQALTRPPAISNTPAALSDEELALLLHQELNSSSRVTRVRHAGSLPHSASSIAPSMLIKHSSISGGKDHNSFSRRNKDVKDGSRSSRELDDEVQRAERLIPRSSDQRRHGKEIRTKRNDSGTSTVVHKRKSRPSSSNPANRDPSSSPDHNSSTKHSSLRRNVDGDSVTVTVPVYRTLPRLISEIMSEGKHMTYEELCNAVLPHWKNLRKHNGERYAYSCHSQAVLDCLRNRPEWAQLVDRGPKVLKKAAEQYYAQTQRPPFFEKNSRRRRMLDTEESDEDEYMKDKTVKESDERSLESQRDDFPKGKQKARRGKRLALQGRGIRNVRKMPKTVIVSDDDDDDARLHDSSEGSMFEEYDSRGSGGAQPVGSEASASSESSD